MSVDELINELIEREGGFVDNQADKGGPTNYGITQKLLTSYLGRQSTVDDIKKLDKKTAYQIYYNFYYIKPGIDKLPKCIQPVVFDAAVNQGQSTAIKFVQDALICHGYPCGTIDGKLGSLTIKMAYKYSTDNQKGFINSIVNRRIIRYNNIVAKDPSQSEFIKGWLARADSFKVA